MNSNNEIFESGAISSIVIRMPLLAVHPYNNIKLMKKHHSKYKDLLPVPLDQNYHHDCLQITCKLPLISGKGENVFIQLYNWDENDNFIRRLQKFIVNGYFSNSVKFVEKYLIVLAAKELYLKTKLSYLNWFPLFYKNFIASYSNDPSFAFVFYQLYKCQILNPLTRSNSVIPSMLICPCYSVWSSHQEIKYDYSDEDYSDKEEMEPTGLIDSLSNLGKAVGSTLSSSYFAFKAGNYDIRQVTNEFTADLMLLVTNFNIYTIVWAFVKLINKIFDIPNLFNMILETFKYCYDSIKKFIVPPDQQNLGGFEATSLDDENLIIPSNVTESYFESFFKNLKQNSPILCAIMATLLVITTGIFMGCQVFNEKANLTKSRARRVSEAFSIVSKTGVSIKNLYNILSIWPKWVYEISYEYLIGEDQTQLEELLMNADTREPEGITRRMFFDEVAYLSNPINTMTIGRNHDMRQKLLWANDVLTDMTTQIANRPATDIKPATSQWVYTKLAHIRSTLMHICRMSCNYSQRFVPFWVNIIGPSGVGKTTLVPDMLNRLQAVLKACEDHKDVVPDAHDQWLYSLNFCSKHLTNYAGQYCVMIDDLFQDASTVGDATPSPLLLIQMVSSQPFSTIQASVDDKGIDFTSKFIISTSNDYHINRKEIVDSTALTRRMNVRVHVKKNHKNELEDHLLRRLNHKQNIQFEVYTSDGKELLYTFGYEELITYICDQYMQWYKLQYALLDRNSQPVNVDNIIKRLSKGEEIPEIVTGKTPSKTKYKCKVLNMRNVNETSPKTLEPTLAEIESDEDLISHLLMLDDLLEEGYSEDDLSLDSLQLYCDEEFYDSLEDIFEPTSSIYCKLFGKGKIKIVRTPMVQSEYGLIEVPLEQYDCDCFKCMGANNMYKNHRMAFLGTPLDFVSIDVFSAQCADGSDDITEHHRSRAKKLWDFVLQTLKTVATHPLTIILTGVATIASLWYMYTVKDCDLTELTTLAYSSGAVRKHIKPKIQVRPQKPIKFQATNYSQLEDDLRLAIPNQNTYDLVYQKILKRDSMCILRKILSNGKVIANSGLRIVGTCILTNHHFFQQLKQGDEFEIVLHNRFIGMSIRKQIFNNNRYVQLGSLDAGVYKCDNKIAHSASLIPHFIENEIPDREHASVMVTIYDPEQFMCPVLVPNITAKPYKDVNYYQGNFTTVDTFATDGLVVQGQSGSLLIGTEPSSHNKILGILVCRSKTTSKGYFKPITRQTLEEAIKVLEVDENLTQDLDLDIELTCATSNMPKLELEYNSLNYLGKIATNRQILQPINTKFTKSLIFDEENNKYEPAVLHPYDERLNSEFKGKSIIYRSIKGFDEQIGAIDTYQLDIAADELSMEYLSWPLPLGLKKTLLNDYQMVNGVRPYLKKLDMRTSPGYPFVKEKSSSDLGKYKWFKEIEPRNPNDGKVFEMVPELKEIVDFRELRARQGYKVPTIAYMCLKDEVRSIEKIKTGATRTFTCLPMDYNLLIRRYFGAFIIAQHYNAGEITSSVGINPAKDWYTIWKRLLTLSDEWEDFDYKNWDQHLHPELVAKVADIVSAWYGDKWDSPEARVRRVLLHDLIHTTIMVKEYLFCKSCGQCSGCAITAELNCIVHDLLMYYVFRKISLQRGYRCNLSLYRQRVQSAMYGDDIIKSTPKGYFFTGEVIKPIMDQLGMHITPGDKLSTEFTLKNPKDITFLKRSFRIDSQELDHHSARAPLKFDIIENIYQWIRKTDDPIEATRTNCETALRETFMYGRQAFYTQRAIINNKIKLFNLSHDIKIKPIDINYENLLDDFANQRLDFVGFEPDSLDEGFIATH